MTNKGLVPPTVRGASAVDDSRHAFDEFLARVPRRAAADHAPRTASGLRWRPKRQIDYLEGVILVSSRSSNVAIAEICWVVA